MKDTGYRQQLHDALESLYIMNADDIIRPEDKEKNRELIKYYKEELKQFNK